MLDWNRLSVVERRGSNSFNSASGCKYKDLKITVRKEFLLIRPQLRLQISGFENYSWERVPFNLFLKTG